MAVVRRSLFLAFCYHCAGQHTAINVALASQHPLLDLPALRRRRLNRRSADGSGWAPSAGTARVRLPVRLSGRIRRQSRGATGGAVLVVRLAPDHQPRQRRPRQPEQPLRGGGSAERARAGRRRARPQSGKFSFHIRFQLVEQHRLLALIELAGGLELRRIDQRGKPARPLSKHMMAISLKSIVRFVELMHPRPESIIS